MELRQLRYFVRAAEMQNFTNAAARLYVTQSTLSQQIKQLEDTLNAPLFDRLGKRIRLTEAGSLFLEYARKTLRDAEEGAQLLQDLNGLRTGRLSVGATYGITAVLVKAIADFSRQYPAIKITVVYGSTNDLLQQLYDFNIDCMLSFFSGNGDDTLAVHPLFSANLSLIAHQSTDVARQKKITPAQLSDLPLVLPSRDFSVRDYFDQVTRMADVDIQPVIEVNDINAILQLANTGAWHTILMDTSLFSFPALKAVPLQSTHSRRKATMVHLNNIYQKKALQAFQHGLMRSAR
ncbi:MAG: LysR family transcriptional regulator [Bacteroidetes bacterium]|nr:LysR family transcriptional regulator [Bacteroidota bacterium]